MSPDFNKKFIGYGVNCTGTNNDLGITSPADSDGHVHYFLYDYEDTNIMNGFNYERRER